MGTSRISWRSEGVKGGCRFVTDAKWVLREEREKKLEAEGGCLLRVHMDCSCCRLLLRLGEFVSCALMYLFLAVSRVLDTWDLKLVK